MFAQWCILHSKRIWTVSVFCMVGVILTLGVFCMVGVFWTVSVFCMVGVFWMYVWPAWAGSESI